MMPYGDKDRARAAEAGDHRRELSMPGTFAELLTDSDGRLPSRGRHYNEGFKLRPSEDYQGEFTLEMNDAGNGSMRVNLDAGDLAALRAALPARQGATAAEVREHLEGLLKVWDPEPTRPLTPGGMEERSIEALRRVISMIPEA